MIQIYMIYIILYIVSCKIYKIYNKKKLVYKIINNITFLIVYKKILINNGNNYNKY